MKKLTLLALLACATSWHAASAQTAITIAAARAQAPTANNVAGPTVTVRGIVTNGDELGSTVSIVRYIQDRTAGIAVYTTGGATGPLVAPLVPGDSIEVTGSLKMYRGLLEIDPIASLTVLAGNRPVPAPVVFTAAQAASAYAEQYEGMLVRINGLTSVNTTGGGAVSAFTANTTYRLNNNTTLVNYVPTNSNGPDGLIGKPSPTGTFDAIGIMSQYSPSATSIVGGYQMLSRKYADFVQGLTPNLTTSPVPSNITTTGFTVSFNTQNAGNTILSYSTSPTGTFTTVPGSTALTTAHSQVITGLQPATIYYVQAVSVNSVGRSESRAVPMITASLSSGVIKNFFNRTVDASLALPGNAAVTMLNGAAPDTLVRYINRATQTLDIAIYNWNNTTILNAVNAAKTRGVQVRVIFEDDNANVSVGQLLASIPRVPRPAQPGSSGSSIMHNKFVIIDAESTNPNVPWVWTGSMNWTPAQLTTDANNVIAIQDQSLARVYAVEFNEMWGSQTATPGTSLFGSRKSDNTPHILNIGGKSVESYFSPTDNVNARLLTAIASADNDLHFESMLVTRADLGRAIANQVTQRGITGCSDGLVNDTSGTAGYAFRLAQAGLGNRLIIKRTAAGFGIMHHKTLIVDAGASQSDPTVFVGSHNWTASADTENDENTLVVHDARVTNRYYQEYAARIAENTTAFTVCRLVLATRAGTVQASTMQAYPNPARGSFQLHLASSSARTATIVLRDVTGRVVLTQTQPLTGTDLNIDATALKSGLYMVQVTTPEAVQTSRVVVE
ncbi:phospholipase D-like domain-containing protein [Hymenobacter siberiensis]|uniref:phospholipase D-like domain-containing protein n=1 Tax=Hymenobacter siberiensis TaxID=2848396 RepID=UPI001C1DF54D|nr:phospholipase D-like domain-containing protein [Hymenobacter siberiensis]MBU6122577.1 T9SS type A sorting domain-containing protein [Hymenobacter siberiensis]